MVNRKLKRRRVIDRSFTRSGEQYFKVVNEENVMHKAIHVPNFYLYQRLVPSRTNHERMLGRQRAREAIRALAESKRREDAA